MIQATIEAAQAGEQIAIEQVMIEAHMLAQAIARRLVPRHNRHHWFDHEDVAQVATEIFWKTFLATTNEQQFGSAVFLAVRKANFNMNRNASATRRSGAMEPFYEDAIAASDSHIDTVDNADAIAYLEQAFPSCREAIEHRLASEQMTKIEAGRFKRMKRRAAQLELADCCV